MNAFSLKRLRLQGLNNSLFLQVSLLAFFGILVCVAITLFVTTYVSERMYFKTIEQNAFQSLQVVSEKIEKQNNDYVKVLSDLRGNWATRGFLQITDPNSRSAHEAMFQFTLLLGRLGLSDNSDSLAVLVTDGQGTVRYTNAYSGIDSRKTPLGERYRNAARQQPNKLHYFFDRGDFLSRQEDKNCMLVLSAVMNKTNSAPIGYVCLLIRASTLQSMYAPLSGEVTRLLISDEQGNILSAQDPALVGTHKEEIAQSIRRTHQVRNAPGSELPSGKGVSVLTRYMGAWGVYGAAIINTNDISATVLEHAASAVWPVALITLCIAIALFIAIERRTKPLRKLIAHMDSVTPTALCTPIQIEGAHEVVMLARAYNVMVGQVNAYVDSLIESERQKRALELKSMRMQINPHFIYNTLTTIKFLAWQSQTDKIIQSIDTLTLLLRSTMSNDEEMIPVKEELKNLESYSFLQETRFGGRVTVNFHADKTALQCLIPKMILQPFIENAFFHAFSDSSQNGTICVFIGVQDSCLVAEIIDNGQGFLQDNPPPQKSGIGIGIANVEQRIKLLFGAQYGVAISSQKGAGTIVNITLPMLQKE